jgi:ClpX C4-type zinc finger
MGIFRVGQQLNCTFCQKSQSDAKVLIASPDKLAYICEECVLQPSRLKNICQESVGDRPSNSSPSGIFGFFRRGQTRGALKCSFCFKKVGLPDLYRSAFAGKTQAQICKDCLEVCRQILQQEGKTGSASSTNADTKPIRIRADFNGLFGELLCISHGESCSDEEGKPVVLRAGMKLTAFDEDQDDDGNRDDLIASGTVEPAPDSLRCLGSRWVLRLDDNGVRHQSELTKNG